MRELARRGWTAWRRSALRAAPPIAVPPDVDAVVLDTLELDRCWDQAVAAVIGGTFSPDIGGHSPWEAASHGVPVIAGLHRHAQGRAFDEVGAIGARSVSQLTHALRTVKRTAGPPRVAARVEAWRAALATVDGPPAPESSPRPLLAPLAIGVAWFSQACVALRHLRRVRIAVPVISVGSTNARSPGRTSIVRALVSALEQRGHRVGVALRGYRRVAHGMGQSWVGHGAAELGDEGALIARSGAWVAASSDRVAAAQALVDQGVSIVVVDDGLQYRRLHRDLDVLVLDARFPQARGWLPAGECRELVARPARVDVVLVQHSSPAFSVEGLPVVRRPAGWFDHQGPTTPPREPVAVFCGIGRPADFLASLDVEVAQFLALPDHAPIDERLADRLIAWSDGHPLVCTAKDAVRLPRALLELVRWTDVEVELPSAFLAQLPKRN